MAQISSNEPLSQSEQRLFRDLVRKKALEQISGEERETFVVLQAKRLRFIESELLSSASSLDLSQAATEPTPSEKAYDRVINALRDYVEIVKSENSAWAPTESKA